MDGVIAALGGTPLPVPPPPRCGVNEVWNGERCVPKSIQQKDGGGRINRPRSENACGCGGGDSYVDDSSEDDSSEDDEMSEMSEDSVTGAFIPGVGPVQSQQEAACAAYRGFGTFGRVMVSDGPCADGSCDPGAPVGLWAIPVPVTVPASGSFVLVLTTPRPANLVACMVDGWTSTGGAVVEADLSVGPWTSESVPYTYPKWGKDSTGGNPNTAKVPISVYDRQAILDGQNYLPPWVAAYDLQDTHDALSVTFYNADPLVAAELQLTMLVNFGTVEERMQERAFRKLREKALKKLAKPVPGGGSLG